MLFREKQCIFLGLASNWYGSVTSPSIDGRGHSVQEGYEGDFHAMPRHHKSCPLCPLLLNIGCFTVRMYGSCYTMYPGVNTTFPIESKILGGGLRGGRRGYWPMALACICNRYLYCCTCIDR